MGIISGIIGGGAGIGQSIINARTQNRNVDATNEANRKMAEYAYSKDLEMWNRNNEYNSPEKQMERLSGAGLNPNLVYGHGAVGNTSGQIPKYNAPTQEFNYRPPVDLATTIGMYQDFQVKQAQIDNLREQNRAIKANADIKQVQAQLEEPLINPIVDPDTGEITMVRRMGTSELKRELMRYNADVKRNEADISAKMLGSKLKAIDLANEYKQKEVNWFIADRLSNMAIKTMGALGISRIGNAKTFTGNVAKGRNHDIPPIKSNNIPPMPIPQRRIITYYK